MRRRDAAGRVLVLPNQTPGVLDRYGLTRADVDRAAWSIDRQGKKHEGAAALNRVVGEFGGPWRLALLLYRVPPVKWAEDLAYRWLAAHRGRFARWGVTPECEQPGVRCD